MSTHWAGIVVFQPRHQTVWVKSMPTWHEHRFLSYRKFLHTDWAGWYLKFAIIVALAMFLLYIYDRQLVHCFTVSGLSLAFFLGSLHVPYDLLEEIVIAAVERPEVLGEVRREEVCTTETTWTKTRVHRIITFPLLMGSRLLSSESISKDLLERV